SEFFAGSSVDMSPYPWQSACQLCWVGFSPHQPGISARGCVYAEDSGEEQHRGAVHPPPGSQVERQASCPDCTTCAQGPCGPWASPAILGVAGTDRPREAALDHDQGEPTADGRSRRG